MSKIKIPFSGGDKLTGILSLYHKILMKNELDNGYGAYQLTLASSNSGLSFGGNQMDISEEYDAYQLFLNIIENTINDVGFTDQEINAIKFHLKIRAKGQSPEKIFGNLLPKINDALSSGYGVAKINERYVQEITMDSDHIENIIQNIINPLTIIFYNTILGRALLFDYNNQFYLAPHGELKMYLDGYKIITYIGKALIVGNSYNIDNHREYLFETKEGMLNKPDVVRRINNILEIVN